MIENRRYRAINVGRGGSVIHAALDQSCAACGAGANNIRSYVLHYSDDVTTVTCKRCLSNPHVAAAVAAAVAEKQHDDDAETEALIDAALAGIAASPVFAALSETAQRQIAISQVYRTKACQ